MKFTNPTNLPLPVLALLAYDGYDYADDKYIISASTLVKPLKQIIMGSRVTNTEAYPIISNFKSMLGTAIHDLAEKACKALTEDKLVELGVPPRVANKIKVNPSEGSDTAFPIYTENRVTKKVGKWKVSGKYDLIFNNEVYDYKTSTTFIYENNLKDKDYMIQGSIYKWLNPDKITGEHVNIIHIFLDWVSYKTSNSTYPPQPIIIKSYPLMSIAETDAFIKSKISKIEQYMHADEAEIPECSEEDLWIRDTKYKVYKNANSTRAKAVFDTVVAAYNYSAVNGGIVKEVKGQAKACNYCSGASICKQRASLISSGLLKEN